MNNCFAGRVSAQRTDETVPCRKELAVSVTSPGPHASTFKASVSLLIVHAWSERGLWAWEAAVRGPWASALQAGGARREGLEASGRHAADCPPEPVTPVHGPPSEEVRRERG